MLLLSPSTIAPFGTGMKGPACAVADAAVSSNPANPIATKVFDMAYVLPGFRLLASDMTILVATRRRSPSF